MSVFDEVWKGINGYELYYDISTYGKVRSLARPIKHAKGGTRTLKSRELKLWRGKSTGYLYVTLSKFGVSKNYSLHRLLALAFIPNPKGKLEVNHIDGYKLNNSLSNLEWCTPSENIIHAYRTGLSNTCGKDHHAARKVVNCRGQVFDTIKDAARYFNLPGKSGISDVCRGINLHAGKYSDGTQIKWKYLSDQEL